MGRLKLYNGDCLEVMDRLIAEGIKVDAIITDPPYGTTKCPWDSIIPFDEMWNRLKEIRNDSTPIVLFGSEPFSSLLRVSNIKEFKYDIYWEKERLTNIAQVKRRVGKTVECVSVFYKSQCTYNPQMVKYEGKKRTNKVKNGKMGLLVDAQEKMVKEYIDNGLRYPTQVLKMQRDVLTSNIHPTQKPVELMEYLIKTYTNEGDTVLDFTMGSGTTGVACVNTGRDFIGIELDENYFNIGLNRISDRIKEIDSDYEVEVVR
jgi:DNA modification methylase